MTGSLPPITDSPPPSDLGKRAVVGVALIVLALTALWVGGSWFGALAALAALLLFAEWSVMHRFSRAMRRLGLVVIGLACAGAMLGLSTYSVLLLAGAAAVALLAALLGIGSRKSLAFALLYAGLPGIALIWLRAQPDGLGVTLWLLVVVWATDILAYFSGRTFGGPKIAPRISPKKTWAGLIGGMLGAAVAGYVIAALWFAPQVTAIAAIQSATAPAFWTLLNPLSVALGSALLAVLSQAGDFYESWLKRKAGVKDSGTLLPGHGGVMDRLDGLVPVAVLVAGIAWARGGLW